MASQQNPSNTPQATFPYEQAFSFSNWVKDWLQTIRVVLVKHWKAITMIALLGAGLGLAYSILKPVRYKSEITFIVEESKGLSGAGMMSSLGSSLGIDLGSITGAGNTVLSGDNVLELLKSKHFMMACLQTPYASNDSTYTLADKYADVYKLKTAWANNSKIGKTVFFGKKDTDIRLQDSLLKTIVKRIEEKEFDVVKPDRKLGFFKVSINTKDELLSKLITERIIKSATDFYVETKVGRLKKNLARMERRADSVGAILNNRTFTATADARMLLNVNPANVNAPVFSEISQRDKVVLSTIYAELTKNVELAKTTLIQETPTVQIVDGPVFPLERIEVKWYQGIAMGFIICFFAGLVWFIYRNSNQ